MFRILILVTLFPPPCFLVVSKPAHLIISEKIQQTPRTYRRYIRPKVPKMKDSLPFSEAVKRRGRNPKGMDSAIGGCVPRWEKKLPSTRNKQKSQLSACGTPTSFSWDGQQHKTGTVRTCSSLLYHLVKLSEVGPKEFTSGSCRNPSLRNPMKYLGFLMN